MESDQQSSAFYVFLNFTKHLVGHTMKSSFHWLSDICQLIFFLFAFHCSQSIFFITQPSRKIDCWLYVASDSTGAEKASGMSSHSAI